MFVKFLSLFCRSLRLVMQLHIFKNISLQWEQCSYTLQGVIFDYFIFCKCYLLRCVYLYCHCRYVLYIGMYEHYSCVRFAVVLQLHVKPRCNISNVFRLCVYVHFNSKRVCIINDSKIPRQFLFFPKCCNRRDITIRQFKPNSEPLSYPV